MANKKCIGHQVNRSTEDFFCSKDQGHQGGHIDPLTRKVWGTPRRPYGLRSAKTSMKRRTK